MEDGTSGYGTLSHGGAMVAIVHGRSTGCSQPGLLMHDP
jgi:hypothetical protein